MRSIFIIWIIGVPLLTLFYFIIPKLKRFEIVSHKFINNKKYHILKMIVVSLLTMSLIILYQTNYVFTYFVPVMCSAKPNLLEGDYLMVDRFWMKSNYPSHGDVIGFKTPQIKFDLIKRCVALGGDTLEIKDGIVLIKNQPEGKFVYKKNIYDPVEQLELEYYKIIKKMALSI